MNYPTWKSRRPFVLVGGRGGGLTGEQVLQGGFRQFRLEQQRDYPLQGKAVEVEGNFDYFFLQIIGIVKKDCGKFD